MSLAPFTQDLTFGFEQAVGEKGANRTRFEHCRAQLEAALPRLMHAPVPEAAALLSLPARTDDLAEIEAVARHIRDHFTDLVVVGMGGSSLGGEVLAQLREPGELRFHVVDNVDPRSLARLTESLPFASTAFLVVSKSGGTVETLALMAALLRSMQPHSPRYGEHFFVITIPNDNPLHRLAVTHGMRVIAHDVDLGGRFSIFSPVGLIPAAALGVDIRALRAGAHGVLQQPRDAVESAALHCALMEKSIAVNVLMHYCDRLGGLVAWYRQCWAESLGKAGKGTIPVRSRGATEQHSQLQLYLEGPKDKFFTALMLDTIGEGAEIGFEADSDPRLDYLSGHRLGDLLFAEQRGTNATLVEAGCPLRSITCTSISAPVVGALLMHFMLEVMFTAELMGVNAFDQPAVEKSKRLTLAYLAGH